MFLRHLLTRFRTYSCQHGGTSKELLGRSLSTNTPKISPGRPRVERNPIVTLDPNKFAEKNQQRLHIGNKQYFRFQIILDGDNRQPLGLWYDIETRRNPYPRDTNAFLYYTAPPERPRIAGELRLRITPSDDPASFASGTDLLRSNGQPWSRPLWSLSKQCLFLYTKLREEGLVPDDVDSILSTWPTKKLKHSLSQILYTLNDTFIVDLSHNALRLPVLTEKGIETIHFRSQFTDLRALYRGEPYTGRVLARFERSKYPEHSGTRTIVLRFLKIITPVKCLIPLYDGYIESPKEGELYRRGKDIPLRVGYIPGPGEERLFHKKTSYRPVWNFNIDRRSSMDRGFQLLWDA